MKTKTCFKCHHASLDGRAGIGPVVVYVTGIGLADEPAKIDFQRRCQGASSFHGGQSIPALHLRDMGLRVPRRLGKGLLGQPRRQSRRL